MAIGTSAVCGSYKKEIQAGIHRWTTASRGDSSAISADTFKVAMFTDSATIDQDTTGYTASNEVTGTAYSAGGAALGSVTLGMGDNSGGTTTAYLDFADTTWSTSTISSAMGALIYNSTLSGASTGSTTTAAAYPAVAMYDFVTAKSSSAGDFTIQWPANTADAAAIRIS
jgi:hypothetical protein|tara:strand:- start:510 stop:1019 length:510 start_codon:yes stop_codon:yes gene_type:complete